MTVMEPSAEAPQESVNQTAFSEETTVAGQLQDLVLDSADVGDFLLELSEYSASFATDAAGQALDCAVTLYRRRRAMTGAGNTARARILNDIQARIEQGPCLTALEEKRTVVVNNTAQDRRWPAYAKSLLAEGIHSVLAVPLVLEQGASASLNFFSHIPHLFTPDMVNSAEQYACQAQKALRLAVRIGSKQQLAEDLEEAMKSRTTIDLAVGVIMGQQRCTQQEAFEILASASSSRNQKLRLVAQSVLNNFTQGEANTHFDA